MRDNPLHIQAFGTSPARRERALTRMFEPLLAEYVSKGTIWGAFSSAELVGVCARSPRVHQYRPGATVTPRKMSNATGGASRNR
jgi:hypothetical protein